MFTYTNEIKKELLLRTGKIRQSFEFFFDASSCRKQIVCGLFCVVWPINPKSIVNQAFVWDFDGLVCPILERTASNNTENRAKEFLSDNTEYNCYVCGYKISENRYNQKCNTTTI